MSMLPRIAVAGFQHESNSFSPFGTGLADFEMADGWPGLTLGSEILEVFPPLNIPIGGFLTSGLFEPVPLAWANAEPAGPVSDEAFETLSGLICRGLAEAGPLDGVYLDLHGAMITESEEDGEGALLGRVRACVGNIPIVASLDMHANITAEMVRLTDAMAVYRTYPHVDMAETGRRCARLMQACLSGRPVAKAFRKLPYLIPITAQCTDEEPFRSIYGALPGEGRGEVLSIDVGSGFPLSDIHECGPAVIAYGFDQRQVDARADAVYQDLLNAESRFENPLLPPKEAVARAIEVGRPGRPVILADVQDNAGCGASSDTTTLLRTLVEAGARNAAAGLLWDPDTAAAAHAAGEGNVIERQLGNRFGYDPHPFRGRFLVERLHDGGIMGAGPIMNGVLLASGPTALLRILDHDADVRVVVSTGRFQCLDRMLFTALGVEPGEQSILLIKSSIHFRADFAPIAGEILIVEAPGAHPCRLSEIPYQRLRHDVRREPAAFPDSRVA